MSFSERTSLGAYIAIARKKKSLSQKELAALILNEDYQPISPQYLNDIEKDRRQPSSQHLLSQFASVLELDLNYLDYLVGKFPQDVRERNLSPQQFEVAFTAFRKNLT